jgi:hypothetical protein
MGTLTIETLPEGWLGNIPVLRDLLATYTKITPYGGELLPAPTHSSVETIDDNGAAIAKGIKQIDLAQYSSGRLSPSVSQFSQYSPALAALMSSFGSRSKSSGAKSTQLSNTVLTSHESSSKGSASKGSSAKPTQLSNIITSMPAKQQSSSSKASQNRSSVASVVMSKPSSPSGSRSRGSSAGSTSNVASVVMGSSSAGSNPAPSNPSPSPSPYPSRSKKQSPLPSTSVFSRTSSTPSLAFSGNKSKSFSLGGTYLFSGFRTQARRGQAGVEKYATLAKLIHFDPSTTRKVPKALKTPKASNVFFRAVKVNGESGIGEFIGTNKELHFYPRKTVPSRKVVSAKLPRLPSLKHPVSQRVKSTSQIFREFEQHQRQGNRKVTKKKK